MSLLWVGIRNICSVSRNNSIEVNGPTPEKEEVGAAAAAGLEVKGGDIGADWVELSNCAVTLLDLI